LFDFATNVRIVLLLLLLPLLACAAARGDRRDDVPVHDLEITFMGDSITAMAGGYATRMHREFPNGVVEIAARSGTSSASWLPGSEFYEFHQFQNRTPMLVTILLGTNDARGAISAEDYSQNVKLIVEGLLADGVQRVILIIPPRQFIGEVEDPEKVRLLAQYRLRLLELCFTGSGEIECGPDLFTELDVDDFDPEGIQQIRVHPNAQGHAKIVSALRPMLDIQALRDARQGNGER
jgi:lysophospholipase L1-like esterase